jgi:hypothetical protein
MQAIAKHHLVYIHHHSGGQMFFRTIPPLPPFLDPFFPGLRTEIRGGRI